MKKFVRDVIFTMIGLFAITFLLPLFIDMTWVDVSFFVGAISSLIAFLFSSSGDFISRISALKTMMRTGGKNMPSKNEESKFSLNPFLVGSVTFFLISFIFPFL